MPTAVDCCWNVLGLLQIAAGFLLNCCWIAAGLMLDRSWIVVALKLDCCWSSLGLLLGCFCIAAGLLVDWGWRRSHCRAKRSGARPFCCTFFSFKGIQMDPECCTSSPKSYLEAAVCPKHWIAARMFLDCSRLLLDMSGPL